MFTKTMLRIQCIFDNCASAKLTFFYSWKVLQNSLIRFRLLSLSRFRMFGFSQSKNEIYL